LSLFSVAFAQTHRSTLEHTNVTYKSTEKQERMHHSSPQITLYQLYSNKTMESILHH